MRNYPVNKTLRVAVAVAYLLALTTQVVSAAAGDNREEDSNQSREAVYKSKVIRGVIATGLNDVLGVAPFDLGAPFGTFNFSMLATQNESGPDPIPLSEDASPADLVVTVASEKFLALAGKTRADVNPAWENIPLRDVPINVDFGSVATHGKGIERPLRGVLSAAPEDVAQAEPSNPITLGQWMKGSGILKIICQSRERGTLKMSVRNLLPNRVYGIGSTLGGFHNLPVNQHRLAPFTIGGVPHLFVTDERGDGYIEREIAFCPLDTDSADRTVLVINLLQYSRHQNYGAVPEPVLVNGLWLGMVTHNHLQFPVNVTMNPDWHGVPRKFWEKVK